MLDATVGSPTMNSYETLDEAEAWWADRPFPLMWTNAANKEGALIIATRMLDALMKPNKKLVPDGKPAPYYYIRPVWLGLPTDPNQTLAFPRTGIFTQNGASVDPTIIPDGIKNATSELAGQMSKSDRLLDSDTAAKGIIRISAGGVSIGFKEIGVDILRVLPEIIYELVIDWITDESMEPVYPLVFGVTR